MKVRKGVLEHKKGSLSPKNTGFVGLEQACKYPHAKEHRDTIAVIVPEIREGYGQLGILKMLFAISGSFCALFSFVGYDDAATKHIQESRHLA